MVSLLTEVMVRLLGCCCLFVCVCSCERLHVGRPEFDVGYLLCSFSAIYFEAEALVNPDHQFGSSSEPSLLQGCTVSGFSSLGL